MICRYNSLISFTNQLLIGLIFKVLWLYLKQSFILLKMLTSISMYLFHISVHIGFFRTKCPTNNVWPGRVDFGAIALFRKVIITQNHCVMVLIFKKLIAIIESHLFKRMKEFNESQLKVELLCIKLAPSSIGLSKQMRFFGISLAYSHSVSFRLA